MLITESCSNPSGQNPALVDAAIIGGEFTSNRRERESKTSASFKHSLEGEEEHEELRRELGVIVYKFDKKEQVRLNFPQSRSNAYIVY